MYKDKTTYLVDKFRGKVVPYASLRKELFLPDLECNQDTNELTVKLRRMVAAALLVELRDERKITVDYLSSCDGKYSWK